MKKTILILTFALFAVSFQKLDAAEGGSPSDCYEWADTLASFEGELFELSHEREYITFTRYYDDCLEYGR